MSSVRQLTLRVCNNEGLAFRINLKTKNNLGAVIPYDLTGATFQSQIRDQTTDALIETIVVTVVDAAAGEITLNLTQADVAAIPVGVYDYDVIIDFPGAEPKLLWKSLFRVEKGVTQWT